jgi:hypothetical protein
MEATSMATATGEMQPPPGYPVTLSVVRPEKQSRLLSSPLFIGTFIRLILLIPHFIILAFFGALAILIYFIATFAILFTGRYPLGLYNLVLAYLRWNVYTSGYMESLYDKYPPFSGEPDPDYPLQFNAIYPERSSRLLNFPFFGLMIRYFLLIPHYIVVFFLYLIAYLLLFIAHFAILFTGSFPAGMHGYITGYTRWSTRLTAYTLGITDKYPPFSLS